MSHHSKSHAVLSIALVLSIVVTTTPVFASGASVRPFRGVIGSVSGVGPVQLRGVSLSEEATVFVGDQLRVADKGYAKVTLLSGQKLEIGRNSDVTLSGQPGQLDLLLRSGNVSFASVASAPLKLTVGAYDISSKNAVSGNVSVGPESFGVHILTGSALVRNLKTKESYMIFEGEERLVTMQVSDGALSQSGSSASAPTEPIGSGSDDGTASGNNGNGNGTIGSTSGPSTTTSSTSKGRTLGLPSKVVTFGILGGVGAAAAIALTRGGSATTPASASSPR